MNLSPIRLFWGIIMLFPLSPLWGQVNNVNRCGQSIYSQEIISQFPGYEQIAIRQNIHYQDFIHHASSQIAQRANCNITIIPVVVHIVYDNVESNITNAQIQSQIDILNQDFRRIFGTPGYGIGADSEIEFCLASKDPNGNITSGITRTESVFSNHQIANDGILKTIISWDDSMYLNIWVVREIKDLGGNPLLGYATMPGMPVTSGVVIRNRSFGNIGTATTPYDLGRTATHEIGHFLGLLHTFESEGDCIGNSENNCLGQGDFICDTPSEEGAKYGCPVDETNSCQDFPCDKSDLLSNYMNFVDDGCMDHFTKGQVQRMKFFLNTSLAYLISPSNLIAVGCDAVQPSISLPEAKLSSSSTTICLNEIVSFFNESPGCLDSILWEFEGGIPKFDSTSNPQITYLNKGDFKVALRIVNSEGSDTVIFDDMIHVAGDSLPPSFKESFEVGIFTPIGWTKEGSIGNESWIRNTFAAFDGIASAVLPNFTTASCGASEDLISPPINLAEAKSARLLFNYSYKQRTFDTTNQDQLIVLVSDDCGQTFGDTIFDHSGADLATVSGEEPGIVFIPSSTEWKSASIFLTDYLGEGGVRLKFRGIGRKGQHLYIDNIRVESTVGVDDNLFPEESLTVFPNPFSTEITIVYHSTSNPIEKIRLMDISGKVLLEQIPDFPSNNSSPITLKGTQFQRMSAGVYLLEVQTSGIRMVKKLIKI